VTKAANKGSSATGPHSALEPNTHKKRTTASLYGASLKMHILPKRPKVVAAAPSSSEPNATNNTSVIPDLHDTDLNPGSGSHAAGSASVYWPGDLLPSECPRARILTWGYDTVVTKKLSAPSNKNNILSHAKDLLFALARERPIGRPIILVAHSLGGIVVKEVRLSARPFRGPLAC